STSPRRPTNTASRCPSPPIFSTGRKARRRGGGSGDYPFSPSPCGRVKRLQTVWGGVTAVARNTFDSALIWLGSDPYPKFASQISTLPQGEGSSATPLLPALIPR